MTFNHDTEVLTEALDIKETGEELALIMTDLARRFMQADKYKISHLAEMIHEELSYPQILLLATIDTHRVIQKSNECADLTMMLDELDTLKQLLDKLKKK
jgi:predicted MarR family transcription regulator